MIDPEKSCKSCLIDFSLLDALLGRERKPSLLDSFTRNHPRDVLANHWPMLEPVPGSTTNDPNILNHRVPINQEIAIRSSLILANTRLHHRCSSQPRYSSREIFPHRSQPTNTNHSLSAVRVKLLTMRIDRDLEPSPIEIRQRINQIVEIDPRRHHAAIEPVIPRRDTKKDNLLPRYMNQLTQQVGKDLRQPWTTGKHELPRFDFLT